MKFNQKITRHRLRQFLKNYSSNQKTLDVGCGDKYYSDLFPNCVTVDIDKQRKPDIVADVYNLPFANDEFEIILCLEVLEHLNNPTRAIFELKRVLKNGGKIILSTRFIMTLHDTPNDFLRYTKYGLKELFNDWHIEVLQAESGTMETVAVILQRLIFQIKFKYNKLIKIFLLVLIKIFLFLNKFIKKEFGDIVQKNVEQNILSSGYYLVAIKK